MLNVVAPLLMEQGCPLMAKKGSQADQGFYSTGDSDDHSLPCDVHMSIVLMDPVIVYYSKLEKRGTLWI